MGKKLYIKLWGSIKNYKDYIKLYKAIRIIKPVEYCKNYIKLLKLLKITKNWGKLWEGCGRSPIKYPVVLYLVIVSAIKKSFISHPPL